MLYGSLSLSIAATLIWPTSPVKFFKALAKSRANVPTPHFRGGYVLTIRMLYGMEIPSLVFIKHFLWIGPELKSIVLRSINTGQYRALGCFKLENFFCVRMQDVPGALFFRRIHQLAEQ